MSTLASTPSGPARRGPAAGEVGVVAVRLAGQRHVQRVVHVVVPLGRHPATALGRGGDHHGVVEVALGDEVERSAELGRQRGHLVGQLGEEVRPGVVVERVHGVEAQRVDVEVAEPAQRVVDEEAAHLGRARRRRG